MDDSEFRQEVVKRAPLLYALAEQPLTMGQLDDDLAMSRSTIHRALGTFEDLGVVRKADGRYTLTGFGRAVTERTSEFTTGLETARAMDAFLNAVGPSVAVPSEHFADAGVHRPQPHEADSGVKRIVDLIRDASTIRMFSNVLSPLYAEVALQEMIEGMELEVVFDERILDLLVSEYAEEAVAAFATGRFVVHIGTDVPFELFLCDDEIAMAAHNHVTRPRIFVETDDQAAVEWGEQLFRTYREGAWEFDPGTLPAAGASELSTAVDN